ncbi:MAG: DUF1669 domain-containing protein [Candidatus Thiodiazotropha sp. (ex Codakia orbicularis)]|nr:DUF1669 domain-containing protein [Candidatus Thiodiazotropha sp. (ex Codakia orbicularis)]
MDSLFSRIVELSEEVKEFPLGKCSPSDDPDKESAYVHAFLDIAKRFIGSLKRIDHDLLQSELKQINTDIRFITEAYALKADLINLIDLVEDITKNNTEVITTKPTLSQEMANKLLIEITENLASESANILPRICTNYGLNDGTIEEAFKSKRNYVAARTAHLSPDEVLVLSKRMAGKYENSNLDKLLSSIKNGQDLLNVVSQFDNIKNLLTQEISNSEFIIWVAVAWFTDRDLANILYSKAKQGVNIQIILNDDDINSVLLPKLKQYFETHTVTKGTILMHNKFCIFDLKKVVHGSYNWTNRAQYNDETVSLIENRAQAEVFAEQFLKLKLKSMKHA